MRRSARGGLGRGFQASAGEAGVAACDSAGETAMESYSVPIRSTKLARSLTEQGSQASM